MFRRLGREGKENVGPERKRGRVEFRRRKIKRGEKTRVAERGNGRKEESRGN